jgi:hypothetical protein
VIKYPEATPRDSPLLLICDILFAEADQCVDCYDRRGSGTIISRCYSIVRRVDREQSRCGVARALSDIRDDLPYSRAIDFCYHSRVPRREPFSAECSPIGVE